MKSANASVHMLPEAVETRASAMQVSVRGNVRQFIGDKLTSMQKKCWIVKFTYRNSRLLVGNHAGSRLQASVRTYEVHRRNLMILPNRLLILSVFLCQSVVGFSASLNAKEMPKESASSEAQSSVHAAVAYKQPNRVVVLNQQDCPSGL